MISIGAFQCLNSASVTADVLGSVVFGGAALNQSLWSHIVVPVITIVTGGDGSSSDGRIKATEMIVDKTTPSILSSCCSLPSAGSWLCCTMSNVRCILSGSDSLSLARSVSRMPGDEGPQMVNFDVDFIDPS